MIKFTGKVLFVQDEERELPVKDKNGVPTQLVKKHRFTHVSMLVKDDDAKHDRPVMATSIDLPSTFVLPKQGETWTTPEIRRYESNNGSPEVSF